MARVSIVLATHDQGAWIGSTIESVRAQTFADWELVIADDGSTDDTAAVVEPHLADPRVRYLPGPRRERAAARNRGVAATSGELVAFLDADDLWHPEKLAWQEATLAADGDAALCYTVSRYIDADGRSLPVRRPPAPLGGHVFPALMRANLMILASVMVRRRALDVAGGFDASLPVLGCEDWDLWLRIARRSRVAVVPEELTLYRRHAGNTSWRQVLESGLLVVDKHYADPSTAAAAALSHAAARARVLWYHAGAVAEHDRGEAAPLVLRALRESPGTLASRPALGALVSLGLPGFVARRLKRLPA